MPHLQRLDGRPLTWAELNAMVADYYRPRLTYIQQYVIDSMDPGDWYTDHEVARYSSCDIDFVRAALSRLSAMGLVEAEDEDDERYWKIPLASPAEGAP